MHPQIISKWIDKEMLLNENISAEILSWLLEEKSITQRIMKDYSFSLELISTKEEIISSEEKAFLGNTEDKIQVRRVKLIANDKEIVIVLKNFNLLLFGTLLLVFSYQLYQYLHKLPLQWVYFLFQLHKN